MRCNYRLSPVKHQFMIMLQSPLWTDSSEFFVKQTFWFEWKKRRICIQLFLSLFQIFLTAFVFSEVCATNIAPDHLHKPLIRFWRIFDSRCITYYIVDGIIIIILSITFNLQQEILKINYAIVLLFKIKTFTDASIRRTSFEYGTTLDHFQLCYCADVNCLVTDVSRLGNVDVSEARGQRWQQFRNKKRKLTMTRLKMQLR